MSLRVRVPHRRCVMGVALILAVLATACSGGGGGKKVLLETAASTGPDAFTSSVHYSPVSSTAPAPIPPVTTTPGAASHVSGATPGLYGGTQNQASCDVEQMISFLGAHPDKAAAWAQVEGISTQQIPGYLRSLTPVILRVDTRITNHGFAGGKATPRQAVLQASTAVLVDKTGVPRAKCACGNPLLPPVASTGATFSGAAWAGFKPTDVVIVNQTTTVNQFVLVDVNTGQQFTRPVGSNGSTDTAAGSGAPSSSSAGTPTGLDGLPTAADLRVSDIVGVYEGDYGPVVFEQAGDRILGSYAWKEGTVNCVFAAGVCTGWWTQTPSRAPESDAGDVVFRFVRSNGVVAIDGLWRYGTTGDLNGRWDLSKSSIGAPLDLTARFNDASAFKAKP
jgi:Domain of unknown function (DUF6777)